MWLDIVFREIPHAPYALQIRMTVRSAGESRRRSWRDGTLLARGNDWRQDQQCGREHGKRRGSNSRDPERHGANPTPAMRLLLARRQRDAIPDLVTAVPG